jgi:anti-sigma B factor antagonist
MEITRNILNDIVVLSINGEVDASTSVDLDAAITDAANENAKKILIDCSNLNYISSAGLGVFMSYINDFESQNIKMHLCCMNETVYSVFEMLGLNNLLQIFSNKDEAIQCF